MNDIERIWCKDFVLGWTKEPQLTWVTSSPPWLSLRKNWMFWGERLQFKSTNKWKATFQIVFCCDTDGKENYLHILELDKHKRNHFLTIQLLACQNNVLGKRLSMVSWVGSSQSCIIRMDYIIIHCTWTLVIVSAPEKSRVLGRFLNTLNIFDDHQLFVKKKPSGDDGKDKKTIT